MKQTRTPGEGTYVEPSTLSEIKSFLVSHGCDFDVDASHVDQSWVSVDDGRFKGGFLVESCGKTGGYKVVVNDWRVGKAKFKRIGGRALTLEEKVDLKLRRKEMEDQTKQEHLRVKGHVTRKMEEWKVHSRSSTLYLTRKRLPVIDSVLVKPGLNTNEASLIVPMENAAGEVWNIQEIFDKGKYFWPGGLTRGLFHVVKGANGPSNVLLGEGFATCLAAGQASGLTAYCAFSCGNLEAVLRVMLGRYQAQQVVLLVDWDVPHHAGLKECVRLVEKYGCRLSMPFQATRLMDRSRDCADIWLDEPGQLTAALNQTCGVGQLDGIKKSLPREDASFEVEEDLPTTEEADGPPSGQMGEVSEAAAPGGGGSDGSDTVEADAVQADEGVRDENRLEDPGVLVTDWSHIVEPEKRQPANLFKLNQTVLPDRRGENGGGAPKATLGNFKALINYLGATLRYNVISKRQEIFLPGVEASPDNYDRVLFAHLEDACARVSFPDEKIGSYVTAVCDENQFNPVVAWVKSRPWDGVHRLERLFATVHTPPEFDTLKRIFIRKWMMMALKAVSSPDGVRTPGMLVFQGPQFIGKTHWLMSLVPGELGLAKEGVILDVGRPDSVREAVGFWLVELGELDGTMERSRQNQLKAFITNQTDILRAPYAKASNAYARRTVFFGSVNEKGFLTDRTGNRRYWVIEVLSLDAAHGLDMQQIWAEVMVDVEHGDQWWPTAAEMKLMNDSNEEFAEVDPVEDALRSRFDWSEHGSDMTATELCNAIGIFNPPKWQTNVVASWSRKLAAGRRPRLARTKKGRFLWVGRPILAENA